MTAKNLYQLEEYLCLLIACVAGTQGQSPWLGIAFPALALLAFAALRRISDDPGAASAVSAFPARCATCVPFSAAAYIFGMANGWFWGIGPYGG
jgi:hypothetical protein